MKCRSAGIPTLGLGLLLVLGTASAQQTASDPLADLEAATRSVTAASDGDASAGRALLDAAVEPRTICGRLVNQVNDLALQWDAVRRQELERETFSGVLDDARRGFALHAARCTVATGQLPFGTITERVLTYESGLVGGVWAALVEVGESWINARPTEDLAASAAVYLERLAAYARWLDGAATFWEGRYLRTQARTCLDDAMAVTGQLAVAIRSQVVLPPEQRVPSALDGLRATQRGVSASLAPCRAAGGLAASDRMELALLGERVEVYARAIAALVDDHPRRLEAAMDEEQRLTERLVRCQNEHRQGPAAVSAVCAAPPTN